MNNWQKLLVGVGCVAGIACGAPSRDGFRAKLAEGCNATHTCKALYDEAQARSQACLNAGGSTADCREEMADTFTASEMVNREREHAVESEREGAKANLVASTAASEEAQRRASEIAKEQSEADCAADRQARIDVIRSAMQAGQQARAETDRREAYAKAHCRRVRVPTFENQMRADPGTGIIRVVRVQVELNESWKCPRGTPEDIVDTSGQVNAGRIPSALEDARLRAVRRSVQDCRDLDANNPDGPEFAAVPMGDK